MRNILLALICLSFSSCSLYSPRDSSGDGVAIRDVPQAARGGDYQGPRQRMVVLPAINAALNSRESHGLAMNRFIIEQLGLTQRVVLIRPSDMGLDLEEYRDKDGGYDLVRLSPKALEAGVTTLLEPSIEDIRVHRKADSVGVLRNVSDDIEATIRIRVISTKNGRALFNDRSVSSSRDAKLRFAKGRGTDRDLKHSPYVTELLIEDMIYQMLPGVLSSLQTMTWEGRIAMVKGDRLYLNVGRLSGLQLGDILKVTDVSNEVFDPETGMKIGDVTGRTKGTLEIVGYFGNDGAVAVVHSGAGFLENDRIELY